MNINYVECEDCGGRSVGPANCAGVTSGAQDGECARTSAPREVKWQAETG